MTQKKLILISAYTIIICLILLFFSCTTKENTNQIKTTTSGGLYDGSWESLQTMPVPSWFEDGKIGIFIHWGPYSVIGHRKNGRGYAEHVPKEIYKDTAYYYPYVRERWGAAPPAFGYKDIIPEFKAEKWDPDQWAQLFNEVGAKYVVMTAEHHDGWANWDSELTPWNAKDMGPQRDLVGDLGKAVRKYGLKYAPSYHRERHTSFFTEKQYVVDASPHPDILEEIRRHPEAKTLYGPFGFSKESIDEYVARWQEIQRKYKPDFLWFDDIPIFTRDGNNTQVEPKIFKSEIQYLYDQCRALITDFMNDANQRHQDVYLNNKGKNRNWPDDIGCLEKDNLKLTVIGPKWQSCTSFGTSYGYLENDNYKSPKEIIKSLVETISRNGNFLVNIGPKADGTVPNQQVDLLHHMGDWLKINGQAIYGTRYWKVYHQEDGNLAFTTKDKTLYAIALEKPSSLITIEATKGWTEEDVKSVQLFGADAEIDWRMSSKGLEISPPTTLGKSKYAWSFEIQTSRLQHSPNVIQRDANKVFEGAH